MTPRHLLERVQKYFPKEGDQMLLADMYEAYREFARKTRILTGSEDVVFEALINENGEEIVTETGEVLGFGIGLASSYSLPERCIFVKAVRFYDVDGNEISGEIEMTWMVHLRSIIFFDSDGNVAAPVSPVTNIVLEMVVYPKRFVLDEELEVESEFAMALVYKKLEELHIPNPVLMKYYGGKYNELKKEAQRAANAHQVDGQYAIRPHFF